MGTFSEHRQKLREGRVTASIVPAILGCDNYKSPLQAFLEITGRVENKAGEAAELGTFFEDAVLRLFEHRSGKKIKRRNVRRVCPSLDLAATLDAELEDEPAIVEAKTTGIASFGTFDGWGEDGTDQVPERVLIQTAAQFIAAPEKGVAYVPLVGGGIGFRSYVIPRNPELCGLVYDGVERFIVDFLEKDVAPPADHRDIDMLKSRERREGVEAQIKAEMFQAYINAKDALKIAEEFEGTARATLLDALGDADIGVCDLGKVTYFKTKDSTAFDAEAFKAAHPDLFASFQKPRPGYRRLLVKATKGGAA